MTETIAERFARDTAKHQMTVLHDDGLYRHLRYRRPETSVYWYDLITWPGCLTVNGDCGTFTFARLDDMFEFFRGQRINPQYWAEWVTPGSEWRIGASGWQFLWCCHAIQWGIRQYDAQKVPVDA